MKDSRFINRELSWLDFNSRVLAQAQDEKLPLLERVKFLAITASNLDEFFAVRVGGLQMLVAEGKSHKDPAGMTASEQVKAVAGATHAMVDAQYACHASLESSLAKAGIRRLRPGELTEAQTEQIASRFESEIYPLLSPIAIRPGEPFPLLASRVLHVGVRLKPATPVEPAAAPDPAPRYAVIPVGRNVPRFLTLAGGASGEYDFLLVEEVIGLFAQHLFPGEPVEECVPFRIVRNADLAVREDQAADLLIEMQAVLNARKRGDSVRLELSGAASAVFSDFLKTTLELEDADGYRVSGPLDLSAFASLARLRGHQDLKDKVWPPQPPPGIGPADVIFDVLTRGDVVLCHPYESFEPVARLVNQAADDPDVLAIKQILYRTSRDSSIVQALMRAALKGKMVTAVVELKARFDEERNIEWAKALEDAGVQVIYGVRGLKTHGKLCLVIRREPQGIRRYMHFGTGNYNETTAQLYSDVSYMTCNDDYGADASAFFNAITGYSQPQKYRVIEAAPIGLRPRLLGLIESETQRSAEGQKALIMAKMNSLEDPGIIEALYAASATGVKILLNVRGICCLRPGVKGLSENISVLSIVDRFLEHSRVFYFLQGGAERVFISSADWMRRNLDRRVELMTPVEEPACKQRLKELLETCLADTVNAWKLNADGSYERLQSGGKKKALRSQETLYRLASDRVAQTRQSRPTVFEPHRPKPTE